MRRHPSGHRRVREVVGRRLAGHHRQAAESPLPRANVRPQREQPAVEVVASPVVAVEEVRLLVAGRHHLWVAGQHRVQRGRPAALPAEHQEVREHPGAARRRAPSHGGALPRGERPRDGARPCRAGFPSSPPNSRGYTISPGLESHQFVFVCGLQRSGTTMLYRYLGEHPSIAALQGTPRPANEGQHNQSVYPADEHAQQGRHVRLPAGGALHRGLAAGDAGNRADAATGVVALLGHLSGRC